MKARVGEIRESTMRESDDLWYIRLPDGRVVRAKSTRALCYHVQSGRVPWNSLLRRESAEEWVSLDWVPELAEIAKERSKRLTAAGVEKVGPQASNEKDTHAPLRSFGVRGLMDELLNALESTFNQTKLLLGATMGAALGLGWVATQLGVLFLDESVQLPFLAGCWVLVLFVNLMASLVLTRMTVLEIARMRPARVREVRSGIVSRSLKLFLVQFLAVGGVAGLLWLSSWLRIRLETGEAPAMPEVLLVLLAVCRLILEVSSCLIVMLSFLLAPIFAVENAGVFATLRQWWTILRVHLGRLLVYEAMVLAVALIVTLPFLAPLALAGWQTGVESGLPGLVRTSVLLLLGGIALTPLLTYIAVANVHVYLNVQYEVFQTDRIEK